MIYSGNGSLLGLLHAHYLTCARHACSERAHSHICMHAVKKRLAKNSSYYLARA